MTTKINVPVIKIFLYLYTVVGRALRKQQCHKLSKYSIMYSKVSNSDSSLLFVCYGSYYLFINKAALLSEQHFNGSAGGGAAAN